MDVTAIIAKSRIQSNTSISQKSDALMLEDLNTIYGDIFSILSTKSKKYAWNNYTPTAIVLGQNEYTIPKETVSIVGLKRVLRIDVKYSSDKEWKHCRQYDTVPADIDTTTYADTENPIAIVRDGSYFIYPAISDSTGSINIEGAYLPLPLTLATTSANIKLNREYHDVLVYGLNKKNFEDKQLFDKMSVYKQLYDEGVLKIVTQGGMDVESGYEDILPDLSDYE